MTQPIDDPSLLFGRRATVQVGDLLIDAGGGTGLDVDFTARRGVKVSKGATKPQPNTCDLSIFNLNADHRKQIEQPTTPGAAKAKVPVVVSAGYRGRQTVIFSGELRAGHSLRNGSTWVTELTTGDGDDALTQTRLSIALSKGSTAEHGIRQILGALGVGEGNLSAGVTRLKEQALAAQLFSRGVVLKGAAAELMTHFCRSVGLEWSIQGGALQLTAIGQPLGGQAIVVDAEHGMLGAPTVDTKGILSVKTEMLPDIAPGVAIAVNALEFTGGFRVLSVETHGDTRAGGEWGHAIEAARY